MVCSVGALRSTGKAALDEPVTGFAQLAIAAASAILGARRIKRALQLRVEVDEDRDIRLPGVFDPDVHLHGMVQDLPVDPSKPITPVPDDIRTVVTLKSAARANAWRRPGRCEPAGML